MKILKNFSNTENSLANPILWAVFGLYVLVSGYTMFHHELWGDEIHSWNIAKASGSFADLISNSRYEGHPPLWYAILWSISKFTHNLVYVQTVHLIIANLVVFLILFFSPFQLSTRMLMPFGYYFLFEYAVISRNYSIAILLAFCICLIITKNFRYKFVLYYLLLFLMTNTHLLAILLAASLHLYFLLLQLEQNKKRSKIILHLLLGILIFLPSLYFISPPSDSQLNIHYWVNRWNVHQLTAFVQAPLFAFLPIPAWWNYHFWNTEFLIEAKTGYSILKVINLFISVMLPVLAFFALRRNKKAAILFIVNFFLSFIIAVVVFPLTAERYAGFIFIGFIAAYWLYCHETPVTTKNKYLVNSFLIVQLIGSVFIVSKDIRLPFSNAYKVNELIEKVPPNERTVTDYWAMNTIAAFADRPFYCVDLQKEIFFVKWNSDLGEMQNRQFRYFEGVKNLFQKEGINKVYMISTGSPKILFGVDSKLFTSYQVKLIDKRDGAIEKGGNLYLYQITTY